MPIHDFYILIENIRWFGEESLYILLPLISLTTIVLHKFYYYRSSLASNLPYNPTPYKKNGPLERGTSFTDSANTLQGMCSEEKCDLCVVVNMCTVCEPVGVLLEKMYFI